jgi:hypothetical protein
MGTRPAGARVLRARQNRSAGPGRESFSMPVIMAFCDPCDRTVYLRQGVDPLFCPVCCSILVQNEAPSGDVRGTPTLDEPLSNA